MEGEECDYNMNDMIEAFFNTFDKEDEDD